MRKPIFVLVLAAFSLPASAQWVAGAGYLNLSDDDELDISVGAVYASVGYLFEIEGGSRIMPELRVGFGVGDDNLFGAVDVEVDTFMALSVRGQFNFASGFYLYARPTYARVELVASGGVSASDDDWDFGIGGGAGYKFTDQVWAELAYEFFDGPNAIGTELKIAF